MADQSDRNCVVPDFHRIADGPRACMTSVRRRQRITPRLLCGDQAGISEVSGQDFVIYERAYAPGFHDLIVGMLRDARLVPNVSQTAGEISTLISLVDAHMGIAILPLSAVKHSVASVIACEIADQIPMSEIGIAVSKGSRATVIDAFRSFALKRLGPAGNSLHANRS
jgi:DNA-binding transcriptional LysR family regulator